MSIVSELAALPTVDEQLVAAAAILDAFPFEIYEQKLPDVPDTPRVDQTNDVIITDPCGDTTLVEGLSDDQLTSIEGEDDFGQIRTVTGRQAEGYDEIQIHQERDRPVFRSPASTLDSDSGYDSRPAAKPVINKAHAHVQHAPEVWVAPKGTLVKIPERFLVTFQLPNGKRYQTSARIDAESAVTSAVKSFVRNVLGKELSYVEISPHA